MNIYIDGSSLNNNSKGKRYGGVGVFFGSNDDRNISLPVKDNKKNKYSDEKIRVSNQYTEILACRVAIEKLIMTQNIKGKKINIYTDSKYLHDIVTKWAKSWESKGWKKSGNKEISHLELIKSIYYMLQNIDISFVHINSHTKEPKDKTSKKYRDWYGNYQADLLATTASNGLLKKNVKSC